MHMHIASRYNNTFRSDAGWFPRSVTGWPRLNFWAVTNICAMWFQMHRNAALWSGSGVEWSDAGCLIYLTLVIEKPQSNFNWSGSSTITHRKDNRKYNWIILFRFPTIILSFCCFGIDQTIIIIINPPLLPQLITVGYVDNLSEGLWWPEWIWIESESSTTRI